MTKFEMMMKVASTEAIDWIGKKDAEAIFYCLLNEERPDGRLLVQAAYVGHGIGEEAAREIFYELMSY